MVGNIIGYGVGYQLRGTGVVLYALLDNGAGAKQWRRQARKALSLTTDCLHQTLSYLLLSLLLRSSSLSLSLLYTSLVAGVIKRMQSEIKWRQHWRHSTQIKSYVLRHSPLSLHPSRSLTHTQPTTAANCWYARLAKEFRIIIRRFTRALRRKKALYGAGEKEEVEGRGQNTHSQLSGYLRRFNAWLMPKDATTDKQCHGKLKPAGQITHTL